MIILVNIDFIGNSDSKIYRKISKFSINISMFSLYRYIGRIPSYEPDISPSLILYIYHFDEKFFFINKSRFDK